MLKTYFEISLGMSAVILLILAVTPVLKKRYRASLRYALWIICAVMMLVPFRPVPKITIEVPRGEISERAAVTENAAEDRGDIAEANAADNAEMSVISKTYKVEKMQEQALIKSVNWQGLFTIVWLFGAAVFMLYHISAYALFIRKVKPWCRRINISGYQGKPETMYCKIVKSPMLTGFFRPRILLPRSDYDKNELSMILNHELTHYKRGDLWIKLLFVTVNALHWFNPIVYIMRKAANRDMEYSCDEIVVKGRSKEFCRDYSMTILNCAADGMKTEFSTYFSEDKKNLKQRFGNILSGKKKRGVIIGAAVVVLAVICAGVFGVGKAADEKENYLFIGLDGREHIDTIMLAQVSKDGIDVTSIPDNTMFLQEYTGRFMPDTIEKLLKTTPALTGKEVNKYVAADIDDALELLSEIDGVKFEIPDLFGDGEGMVYDDPYQNLHIDLKPGEHELTGEEMLQVMRYRRSNMKDDGYNTYDEGDLDRIKMTHSLLEQLVNQKRNILLSDEFFEAARGVMNSTVTNIGADDVRKILKAAATGDVTFTLLKGGYSKNVLDREVFYAPNVIYNDNAGLWDHEKDNSIISAIDITELSCEVVSLTIDGEEQIAEARGHFGIWYNERTGELHTCMLPELKDGSSIVIQPFELFELDGYSARGTARWSRQIRKGDAAESVLSDEYIDCTITGLDTENPVFRSDDGRYEVKLRVI